MGKCASSDGILTEDQAGSSIEINPGIISHEHRGRVFVMHFCAAAPVKMSADRQGNVFVSGLRIVASMCSVSGCLQSHTPAREQLAVLSDGSLRHMATGVFTELYKDEAKRRTIPHSIVPFKTSNDPVVYGAPLPDAG